MHKIKFQNYRLKAEQIEIVYPRKDFDTERPVEYDIYAHGIRLGTTHNQVLNFKLLLQNAYLLEKNWRAKANDALKRGSQVMPDPEISHAQTLMMIANHCPSLDKDLGEPTDKCWNVLSVNRLDDWMAVPHVSEEEMIRFKKEEVIGQFS